MEAVTLYATWPDLESAKAGARRLVEGRLAACVTLLPNAISTFRWDGEIQEETEVVMLIKTRAERASAARDAILAAHPYDVPCVTGWPIDPAVSNRDYVVWVSDVTT